MSVWRLVRPVDPLAPKRTRSESIGAVESNPARCPELHETANRQRSSVYGERSAVLVFSPRFSPACFSAESIHEAEWELGTRGLRAMPADRSLNGMPEENWRSTGVIPTADFQGPFFARSECPGPGQSKARSERLSRRYFRSYDDE
jgi:hypothetical protein